MRTPLHKFIQFLQSLVNRLPFGSRALRPLLWLWYTLLRLCRYTRNQDKDKDSSQGPTTRVQNEKWEKPANEKVHKLPLTYDTPRIPRISVISCSSAPPMSSTRSSEDLSNSSPQTPNFPFPVTPPPVITTLRNTHRQQTSLSTVSSALSPTETVYGDTSFGGTPLYDSPSNEKEKKNSIRETRRQSQSSFSSYVPTTAAPRGAICAPPSPQDKDIFCIHPGASDRWDRKIERSGISIF